MDEQEPRNQQTTDDPRRRELGEFLKRRRATLSPDQVGLGSARTSRRRSAGLRREEVAALAGIGISWYSWLEQAKPIRVSREVIEGVMSALRLSRNETRYVYQLLDLAPPVDLVVPHGDDAGRTDQALLDGLCECINPTPCLIIDQDWNVVARNSIAKLIFIHADIGSNLLFNTFAGEAPYLDLFDRPQAAARDMIAHFRLDAGSLLCRPTLMKTVDALRRESDRFNEAWKLQEVAEHKECRQHFMHPTFGELRFVKQSWLLDSDTTTRMVVYVPDDPTRHALEANA